MLESEGFTVDQVLTVPASRDGAAIVAAHSLERIGEGVGSQPACTVSVEGDIIDTMFRGGSRRDR